MTSTILVLCVALAISEDAASKADERVFSGPQASEKLVPFKVRGAFDDAAGKEIDFVTAAGARPLLLLFVHEANRPSIGFQRVLMTYAQSRSKDGLANATVWLADDATAAEEALRRMRHALAKDAPLGISLDGREGPGAYGLNRNVTLTVLVAKEGRVTANFALVQPSIQVDLPQVLAALARAVGGEPPRLEDLPGVSEMLRPDARRPSSEPDPRVRELVRPVIQLNATVEQVEAAAAKVEKYAAENERGRKQIGQSARTVVESGKLENYGTPRAQEFFRKWAREYGGLASPRERKF